MKTIKLIIKGEVQGVFFRVYAKKIAEELGIKGYSKNLPDGNVEIIGQGDEYQLEKFIEKCKNGPPLAKVDDIEITDVFEPSVYIEFYISH